MLFLVRYDRGEGKLVSMESFPDAARNQAQDMRLELELALNREGVQHEVVILQAATEIDLRRTHRRYFEDLEGLSAAHSSDSTD